AEDQRPLGGPGDRPDAVLAGGERLPGDQYILGDGEGGGLVGARTPHLAPRYQVAEQRAAARGGPVVHDGHLSRAERLHHRRVLALASLGGQRRPGDRQKQRDRARHRRTRSISAATAASSSSSVL